MHGLLARAACVAMVFFTVGAGPPTRRVSRVDRMWAVGAPALDASPAAGVYAWVSEGRFSFAAVPFQKPPHGVYQWTLRSAEPLEVVEAGDCKVAARTPEGLVLAAQPRRAIARCSVRTEGELAISRVRVGARPAPLFVGPLARSTTGSLRIGRYGPASAATRESMNARGSAPQAGRTAPSPRRRK